MTIFHSLGSSDGYSIYSTPTSWTSRQNLALPLILFLPSTSVSASVWDPETASWKTYEEKRKVVGKLWSCLYLRRGTYSSQAPCLTSTTSLILETSLAVNFSCLFLFCLWSACFYVRISFYILCISVLQWNWLIFHDSVYRSYEKEEGIFVRLL